ncbi:hypothetical protein FYZ48_18415 [Gimesia chilikensis]|uniref:hypothetical protein n=1 Tax=Gimesia chilikensis TaxID=2605989 RepID=UPI0011EFB39B|nr:hypothetical protein [Gimesia chilikensis]KAA0135286.1 hypothetical protein FYZ48_18415 [Gimesia chilikensis]
MRALFIATSICLMCIGTTPPNTAQAEDKPAKPTLKTVNWPVKFTVKQKQAAVPQQVVKVKQPFYPELNPRVQQIQDALNTNTRANFPNVPLTQALNEIQKQHGINMYVSGSALKELGITADEPVNVSLHGVSLKSALKIILEPLGLAYEIDQEVLKITTQAEVDRHLITRIYPVGILCHSAEEYEAIEKAIGTACRPNIWARRQRLSAQSQVMSTPAPSPFAAPTGMLSSSITAVPQCQALVVNETEEIHEKIVELLTQLRQVRQIQMRAVPETN